MWHLLPLPHIYSSFFFTNFATYLQRENWCTSILGLWYFQGYIFQPGIYGILHVLEGYRVISILMWLFRGLHNVTILHVLTYGTRELHRVGIWNFLYFTYCQNNARKWCLAPFWWSFISVFDFSLWPSWIFPKRSSNDFGWNLLHVRLK